jgi:hypothetical protein
MTVEQLSEVCDFKIANEHGEIVFPGLTDLRKVNLSSVSIFKGDVALSPTTVEDDKLDKPINVTLRNLNVPTPFELKKKCRLNLAPQILPTTPNISCSSSVYLASQFQSEFQ